MNAKRGDSRVKTGVDWPTPNARKHWKDSELKFILGHAPTKSNAYKLAKKYGRGIGSLEQIFRWVGQSTRHTIKVRGSNTFNRTLLRLRKEVGWLSVGGN